MTYCADQLPAHLIDGREHMLDSGTRLGDAVVAPLLTLGQRLVTLALPPQIQAAQRDLDRATLALQKADELLESTIHHKEALRHELALIDLEVATAKVVGDADDFLKAEQARDARRAAKGA